MSESERQTRRVTEPSEYTYVRAAIGGRYGDIVQRAFAGASHGFVVVVTEGPDPRAPECTGSDAHDFRIANLPTDDFKEGEDGEYLVIYHACATCGLHRRVAIARGASFGGNLLGGEYVRYWTPQ